MRVDLIVFGFSSVNGFHVKSVTQNEGNVVLDTEVSNPVPGEHALDSHGDILPEGC